MARIGFMCWEIWKARNNATFQQAEINPQVTIIKVNMMESEFRAANRTEETTQAKTTVQSRRRDKKATWRPPKGEWIKANVDAAYQKQIGEEQVIIESDSLTLVQAVKPKARIGEIERILKDIQCFASEIPKSGFTWISREGNFLAHQVAKKCLKDELTADWTWNLKGDLKQIAFLEARGLNSCIHRGRTEGQLIQQKTKNLAVGDRRGWQRTGPGLAGQVNFENGRRPHAMQSLAAQEEREQITSFRPGDEQEASLKLDCKMPSTGATMEEYVVGIAASISEELMTTDTIRRRPLQCRQVQASSNNGDSGYDGAAGGNRGAGDGGMEGKHHDTGAGEVMADDSDAGDVEVVGEGNEVGDGGVNRMLHIQILGSEV
ncbi:hypothetical protein AHAS_Ahas13G0058300 [Arachis hypogaea]